MDKLRIIKNLLLILEFLVVAGLCFATYVVVSQESEIFIPIGEPDLEITSRDVQENMRQHMPQSSGDPVILEVTGVDFSIQATPQLKGFIVAMALLIAAYGVIILEIFQRIVSDVREKKPFNYKNIRRVKLIGILITCAPIFEYALRKAFVLWIESKFTFDQMKLVSDADHGWSVFIIGLLIIVLGVAFEQAQKMQEENELTV